MNPALRAHWKGPAVRLGLFVGLAFLTSTAPGAPSAGPSARPPAGVFRWIRQQVDFGETYQGNVLTGRFRFRNEGAGPLRLLAIRPASKGGRVLAWPHLVPPGDEGTIDAEQTTDEHVGTASFGFVIETDEPGGEKGRKALLSGFVLSAFDPPAGQFDFGSVDRRTRPALDLELFCREVDRLEVLGIDGLPPFLEVKVQERLGVEGEGVRLVGRVLPNAPLGTSSGIFHVRTNVPHQPRFMVGWMVHAFDDVVASTTQVSMDLAEIGEWFDRTVTFRSRTGAAFEIVRIDNPWPPLMLEEVPCPAPDGPPGSCRGLRFRVLSEPDRQVGGLVQVWIAGATQPIPIRYRGIVVLPGARIRKVPGTVTKAIEPAPAGEAPR